MDGRKSRCELNELVENLTCLNALAGGNWKSNPKIVTDEKSWKIWKNDQNSVMNEELVQNRVMNGKFVKNFVINAKIDPKVVMDLSVFEIGGWNSLHPSNQQLLEEFVDGNEPWLLIGIPSRDPCRVTQYLERHSVSSDQHMKKLMSLREGLHVMMQCYMRQHFADLYWHMNIQEDMHRGENLR